MEGLATGSYEVTPEEIAAREALEQRKVDAMTKLRSERDALIPSTDKYAFMDFPIRDELRQKWGRYRQHLRDLPAMSSPDLDEDGNLTGVEWPAVPSNIVPISYAHEKDLQTTRTDLQTTQTDLQTTRTDLQTTRTDLQTTQTDLQTTRTDLQTEKAKVAKLELLIEGITARMTEHERQTGFRM
jgi:hypothetical protein